MPNQRQQIAISEDIVDLTEEFSKRLEELNSKKSSMSASEFNRAESKLRLAYKTPISRAIGDIEYFGSEEKTRIDNLRTAIYYEAISIEDVGSMFRYAEDQMRKGVAFNKILNEMVYEPNKSAVEDRQLEEQRKNIELQAGMDLQVQAEPSVSGADIADSVRREQQAREQQEAQAKAAQAKKRSPLWEKIIGEGVDDEEFVASDWGGRTAESEADMEPPGRRELEVSPRRRELEVSPRRRELEVSPLSMFVDTRKPFVSSTIPPEDVQADPMSLEKKKSDLPQSPTVKEWESHSEPIYTAPIIETPAATPTPEPTPTPAADATTRNLLSNEEDAAETPVADLPELKPEELGGGGPTEFDITPVEKEDRLSKLQAEEKSDRWDMSPLGVAGLMTGLQAAIAATTFLGPQAKADRERRKELERGTGAAAGIRKQGTRALKQISGMERQRRQQEEAVAAGMGATQDVASQERRRQQEKQNITQAAGQLATNVEGAVLQQKQMEMDELSQISGRQQARLDKFIGGISNAIGAAGGIVGAALAGRTPGTPLSWQSMAQGFRSKGDSQEVAVQKAMDAKRIFSGIEDTSSDAEKAAAYREWLRLYPDRRGYDAHRASLYTGMY